MTTRSPSAPPTSREPSDFGFRAAFAPYQSAWRRLNEMASSASSPAHGCGTAPNRLSASPGTLTSGNPGSCALPLRRMVSKTARIRQHRARGRSSEGESSRVCAPSTVAVSSRRSKNSRMLADSSFLDSRCRCKTSVITQASENEGPLSGAASDSFQIVTSPSSVSSSLRCCQFAVPLGASPNGVMRPPDLFPLPF